MRAAQVMCFLCGGVTRLDESRVVTVRKEGRKGKLARICPGHAELMTKKGVASVMVDGERVAVRLKRGGF